MRERVTADEIDRGEVERRIGLSEEIAGIVQFLVSPAASYVVGDDASRAGRPAGDGDAGGLRSVATRSR